jgi:cytochrome c556
MNLTNLFYVMETPGYMTSLTNYQKAIERMLLASTGKDLKEAATAYERVVESCVECHRTFRTTQRPKPVHP